MDLRAGLCRSESGGAGSGGAWGVHQGRIYFAGGEGRTYQFSAAFKVVEAYDPAANVWTVGLAGDAGHLGVEPADPIRHVREADRQHRHSPKSFPLR